MKRYELRLAGSGGQGLILAGIILAEAAGVHAGYHVVQTQSYGPESRGGASRAEVIISDEVVDYPKVTQPDVVLCLTREACQRYVGDLVDGGLLVVDESLLETLPAVNPSVRVVALPLIRTAKDGLGREIVANVVALGAVIALTNIVPPAAAEKALLARVPKGTTEINRQALACGLALGREEGVSP